MSEPGKLEKGLKDAAGTMKAGGKEIDIMLEITHDVLAVMEKFTRENEPYATDTIRALEDAAVAIPKNLPGVREIDAQKGE